MDIEQLADIDRTIAVWNHAGLSPAQVWQAMGNEPVWAVSWREVRARMIDEGARQLELKLVA